MYIHSTFIAKIIWFLRAKLKPNNLQYIVIFSIKTEKIIKFVLIMHWKFKVNSNWINSTLGIEIQVEMIGLKQIGDTFSYFLNFLHEASSYVQSWVLYYHTGTVKFTHLWAFNAKIQSLKVITEAILKWICLNQISIFLENSLNGLHTLITQTSSTTRLRTLNTTL